MSAPAFTPGPWMVNPADAYEVAPAQPDGRIDPCLIVRLSKLATHAKANARLIAAAPELYEALHKLSLMAQTTGGAAGRDEQLVEAIHAASLALAKARGEQ